MTPHGENFRTALVVESALAHRIALRGMLLNAGYTRVLQAEDEEDGLSALSAELIHIVFTSWEPKRPAGRKILAFLRKKGRHRQIPVVVLDGGLRRQTRVAAVKAGIGGILPLPVKASDLRELLRNLPRGGEAFRAKEQHET